MGLRTTSILCATFASLAAASGAGMAQAANACANAETNLALKECLGKAYLRADKELNVVWKKVMGSISDADYLTPEQRGRLEEGAARGTTRLGPVQGARL